MLGGFNAYLGMPDLQKLICLSEVQHLWWQYMSLDIPLCPHYLGVHWNKRSPFLLCLFPPQSCFSYNQNNVSYWQVLWPSFRVYLEKNRFMFSLHFLGKAVGGQAKLQVCFHSTGFGMTFAHFPQDFLGNIYCSHVYQSSIFQIFHFSEGQCLSWEVVC